MAIFIKIYYSERIKGVEKDEQTGRFIEGAHKIDSPLNYANYVPAAAEDIPRDLPSPIY